MLSIFQNLKSNNIFIGQCELIKTLKKAVFNILKS